MQFCPFQCYLLLCNSRYSGPTILCEVFALPPIGLDLVISSTWSRKEQEHAALVRNVFHFEGTKMEVVYSIMQYMLLPETLFEIY
jgi:hypothetical protein